jgi:histidine phosphotransferase ChpT
MDLTETTGLTEDLTALLGSRICHDLISPLGAIGNGVELLALAEAAGGPELALISESVRAATARIRFFRIAFGAAVPGRRIGRAEVLAVLDDLGAGGRVRYDWQGPPELARGEVKLAFLALLCLETALPFGGRIAACPGAGGWRVEATGERLKPDSAPWDRLRQRPAGGPLAAAHVQFALLADEARRQGRMLTLSIDDGRILIGF